MITNSICTLSWGIRKFYNISISEFGSVLKSHESYQMNSEKNKLDSVK